VEIAINMDTSRLVALSKDPMVHVGIAGILLLAFLTAIFAAAFLQPAKYSGPLNTISAYGRFAYACFFKPHTGDDTGSQQDALESFYKHQAAAYDATRTRLLHGREDMLSLVASQLKEKHSSKKPIWVDVRNTFHTYLNRV
jgi:betaine lipid synthase